MKHRATITITSGPDRGKVFELEEELTHLGKGQENHLMLSDPLMTTRQATIVNRSGRYAIYTPLEHTIEVDGSVIPSERWVWLPTTALVRVSDYTSFQFASESQAEEGDPLAPAPPVPPTPLPSTRGEQPKKGPPPPSKRTEPKKGEKKKKEQVARFITDASGDTLVKLGQDGHLPELHLEEEASRRKSQKKSTSGGGSTTLYILLGVSMLASITMLFIDMGPREASTESRQSARAEIQATYFPKAQEQSKLYQEYLQQARFAHLRGDRTAEIRAYRRVLDLLNAEDLERFNGLTGSPDRDRELRKLIGIIISK